MTTDLSDLDLTLGRGDDLLIDAVGQAVSRFHPGAVFVYLTCIPSMAGVDIESVARRAQLRWQVPVIPVDCGGFYGNKNFGQRIAGDALFRHVIGTREPDPVDARMGAAVGRVHDVNLIGEWNVGGEFWNVAPLFDELGLRLLCVLSGDSRFRDVQTMHRAEANMLVCSKALQGLARDLEGVYGTPFFEGSFYGAPATSQALRAFASLLNDSDLAARTERIIEREEASVQIALASVRPRLQGKRALIFSGGFKSWSTVSALQYLGVEVVATGIEKSTDEDVVRIRELLGPNARLIDNNDQETILRAVAESRADVLVAGDRYIYPSLKATIPFLDLDHVREIGYAGYKGQIEFGRRLVAAIEHPAWNLVRRDPPWERRANRRAVA
jgi:nitrogenase molybdenum-cofactor synthesis protein NifE